MKLWLSAAEIADLGLPGLPATKRNINALAESQGWSARTGLCRRRASAGGGVEYHLDILPPEARQAYIGRFVAEVVPLVAQQAAEAEPQAAALRADAAEARDARLAILAAADHFQRQASLPRRHADLRFVEEVLAGRADLPEWVRQAASRLSLRTLQRWRAEAKAGRTARLAVDRGARRRGTGVMDTAEDGQVRVFALALIAHQPHLSADHVRGLLLARFGETVAVMRAGGVVERVPLPPMRTIQEALKRWKETEKVHLTAITNPDGFKSRFRASGSNSDHGIVRPNQLWQIDASPMDALCVDGRHSVYLALDIYTRRIVVYVSRTPRAEAVGLMLRRAILAWGVPERIKTDNGSDFTAKSIQRLLAHLGIERELSPAFTPEAKAHVERAVGTFQRDFAPLLPGYVGHSVADRKVIEARRTFAARIGDSDDTKAFCVELNGADLQGYCDRWAADRYQHRPHAGLSGATPFQVASAYAGSLRRIEDMRALDVLLAPVAGRDGVRTVGKQGIRIDGSHYLVDTVLPDTQVLVRMDPADLGRVWLFDVDGGAFLGEAICPELAGIDPVAANARRKQAQRELIQQGTAEIRREARKIKPRDLVDTLLREDAERAGKLVAFPRATQVHATPELDAAAAAVAPPPEPAATFGDLDRAMLDEIERELAGAPAPAADNVVPLRTEETDAQRFRRAREIQGRLAAGLPVTPQEAFWLGHYAQGSEYRSLAQLVEDFGESALL